MSAARSTVRTSGQSFDWVGTAPLLLFRVVFWSCSSALIFRSPRRRILDIFRTLRELTCRCRDIAAFGKAELTLHELNNARQHLAGSIPIGCTELDTLDRPIRVEA